MEADVLFLDGGLGVVFALVWIFCVVDVIMTPEQLCRNLPKLAWVFIVLLFFDIGALAWLLAGRPWGARTWAGVGAARPSVPSYPPAGGSGHRTGARPTNPDDDEEFLASLRQRAEEQRRRAREAAERERDERDDDLGDWPPQS
jgi:hypothetical protein